MSSDTIKILILVGLTILTIIIIYKVVKWKIKHKTETITAFTGGLGAGKTWLGVLKVNFIYFCQKIKWVWKNFKIKLKNSFKHLNEPYKEKPQVYSNIPIVIGWKKGKPIFSRVLKIEHLLEQERIEEGSVVFIDEIGSIANQFEWQNKNVTKTMDDFIRFFRHYTKGGYLVITDQCSENINLVIRRRINIVHNLANMLCIGPLMFYFERMISVSEEIKTVDMRNVENDKENDTQNNMTLRFRFITPRQKKLYDTYCHSEAYNTVPNGINEQYDGYKCYDRVIMPSDKYKFVKGKITVKESTIKKELDTTNSKC